MANILVTDDAAFMRKILTDLLQKNGHNCYEACDGSDMLNKYDELKPDVVTLDITMPKMDGLEAVKALHTKHPDCRVIMCSAMGQQAMVIQALQSGAKDFIVKPFDQKRVIEAVNKVLR